MLTPVSFVAPGAGSLGSSGGVLAGKGTSVFGYASPSSVILCSEQKSATPEQQSGATAAGSTFHTTGIFGASGEVVAFDFNESFVAAILAPPAPAPRTLSVWQVANGELNSSKVPARLSSQWKTEGSPLSLCVAGKHHIIIGTAAGHLLSLNTAVEQVEAKSVTLPSRTPGELTGVVTVTSSKVRPDLVACGTNGGLLGVFSLSASTGLRMTVSVQPFPATTTDGPPLPVTHLAFSPFSDNYLVLGSTEGAVSLYSVDANALIQSFTISSRVSGLAWSQWEQGNFYMTSTALGCVLKFNANQKQEVERINPGLSIEASTTAAKDNHKGEPELVGLRGITTVDSQGLVLAGCDGAVTVYHPSRQQVAFRSAVQHTLTAIGAASARHDASQFATCAKDGVIHIWSTARLDRPHTTLRLPVGSSATALQWSGTGKSIYAGLFNGEVVSFSISTQLVTWRLPVFAGVPVHAIQFAVESGMLIASSAQGVAVVSKDGKLVRRMTTPCEVNALDLEVTRGKAIAVGGSDRHLYVYPLSIEASTTPVVTQPLLTLQGHTRRITGVAFNRVHPTFIASCSEDGTARVWDLSLNEAQRIASQSVVLAPTDASASAAVRCVVWCAGLAPYLLVTGREDGAVCLWDTRGGGQLLATSATGPAPIRSLLTHTFRPAMVVSHAADGAITCWSLHSLKQPALDACFGMLEQRVTVTDAASCMHGDPKPHNQALAMSASVQTFLGNLASCTKPIDRMEWLTKFFDSGSPGLGDLLRQATITVNPAAASMNTVEAAKHTSMLPVDQLVEATKARTQQTLEKVRTSAAKQTPAYRRRRLSEVAAELMQCGMTKEAVGVWCEAGDWETALAIAPSISREFWLEMCAKAAVAMEGEGRLQQAVVYWIACGESVRAAQLSARATAPSLDTPLVIVSTCPQATAVTPDAATVAATLAATRTQTASTSAPAAHAALLLHERKNDEAVRTLAHAGEVALAHLLIHTVPLQEQSTIDLVYRLDLHQSCRAAQFDAALFCASAMTNHHDGYATAIASFQAHIPAEELNQPATQEKLRVFYDRVRQECTRVQVPLDHAVIQQQHSTDGLASQNQLAALVINSDPASGPFTASAIVQSFNGFLESLLNVALQDIDGPNSAFFLRQAYSIAGYVTLPPVAPLPSEYSVFLSLSFLITALMCVKVYRFPQLLNFAFSRAAEHAQGNAMLDGLMGRVRTCVGSYSSSSVEVQCSPNGKHIMMVDPAQRGARFTSMLTELIILGPVIPLPKKIGSAVDGKQQHISEEEALMWGMVSHFSPLADGSRLSYV